VSISEGRTRAPGSPAVEEGSSYSADDACAQCRARVSAAVGWISRIDDQSARPASRSASPRPSRSRTHVDDPSSFKALRDSQELGPSPPPITAPHAAPPPVRLACRAPVRAGHLLSSRPLTKRNERRAHDEPRDEPGTAGAPVRRLRLPRHGVPGPERLLRPRRPARASLGLFPLLSLTLVLPPNRHHTT
jgi:hypothetical protein